VEKREAGREKKVFREQCGTTTSEGSQVSIRFKGKKKKWRPGDHTFKSASPKIKGEECRRKSFRKKNSLSSSCSWELEKYRNSHYSLRREQRQKQPKENKRYGNGDGFAQPRSLQIGSHKSHSGRGRALLKTREKTVAGWPQKKKEIYHSRFGKRLQERFSAEWEKTRVRRGEGKGGGRAGR